MAMENFNQELLDKIVANEAIEFDEKTKEMIADELSEKIDKLFLNPLDWVNFRNVKSKLRQMYDDVVETLNSALSRKEKFKFEFVSKQCDEIFATLLLVVNASANGVITNAVLKFGNGIFNYTVNKYGEDWKHSYFINQLPIEVKDAIQSS